MEHAENDGKVLGHPVFLSAAGGADGKPPPAATDMECETKDDKSITAVDNTESPTGGAASKPEEGIPATVSYFSLYR